MRSEQELMDELKEMYPQYPSKEFKSSTEKLLRMKARDLEKKEKLSDLRQLFQAEFSYLFSFFVC